MDDERKIAEGFSLPKDDEYVDISSTSLDSDEEFDSFFTPKEHNEEPEQREEVVQTIEDDAGGDDDVVVASDETAVDEESKDDPIEGVDEPKHSDNEKLSQIEKSITDVSETEKKIFSEVREMHKLYHNEFAGRLKTMQDELEQYRKVDKGRVFDDILGALARIYGNNETLADEVEDPKAKKNIKYLLLDIEDLLESYGMSKLRSSPGDKRNPRHCQILERIPTDDPEKHDTIAKSYNSGFYIGNRTVIKEVVDIYFFEGQKPVANSEENNVNETGNDPVSE